MWSLVRRPRTELRPACPRCRSEIAEVSEGFSLDLCYECAYKGHFVPTPFAPGEGTGPVEAWTNEGRAWVACRGIVRHAKRPR